MYSGLVTQLCPTLATAWTVAHQAPLSLGLSRQEYWSGFPFPPPGDLPDPGIQRASSTLQVDSLPLSHQGRLQGTELPSTKSSEAGSTLWATPVSSNPGCGRGDCEGTGMMLSVQTDPRLLWAWVLLERGLPASVSAAACSPGTGRRGARAAAAGSFISPGKCCCLPLGSTVCATWKVRRG